MSDPECSSTISRDKSVVIFDGQCNFCLSQIRILRFLDLGNRRLTFLSLHDPAVSREFPQLKHEDLMQEMHIVEPTDRVHTGSDAVKYLVLHLPSLWITSPIFYLPGTGPIWKSLYRWVANNRYRLAGKNCDSGNCKLP